MVTKSALLELKNVRKVYVSRRGKVEAIGGVSFIVNEGEFVTIVGPSGCGKSTLLKIIAGLLPYDQGHVEFRGRLLTGPVKEVGLVFQQPALFPWKTVLGNILAPIELMGLRKKDYLKKARELLVLANLRGFEKFYPKELSGGMQQRVAICRALIHDPKLLLMDEPFGALDAMTRDMMNLEIQRIWKEIQCTVLFVTHSIHEAIFLGDKVVVLSNRPSVVREIIPIGLPRPRSLEIRASPEFGNHLLHLLDLLRNEFIEGANVEQVL